MIEAKNENENLRYSQCYNISWLSGAGTGLWFISALAWGHLVCWIVFLCLAIWSGLLWYAFQKAE